MHNNTHPLCFLFFLALNCYFLRALGQKGVGGFELDRDVSAPHEVAEQTHMVFMPCLLKSNSHTFLKYYHTVYVGGFPRNEHEEAGQCVNFFPLFLYIIPHNAAAAACEAVFQLA